MQLAQFPRTLKETKLILVKLRYLVFGSDFVRKVTETFTTRIFLLIVGMITSIIVARSLGPEGRGLYSVAVTTASLGVQFGNMGLHSSNTFFVSRDRELLPQLVGNSLLVSSFFGLAGIIIIKLILLVYPEILSFRGSLLSITLAWIPFGLAFLLLQNLLIGINEIRAFNVSEIVSRGASLVIIILLFIFRVLSVESVLLAGFVSLIVGLAWISKKLINNLRTFPTYSFILFQETFSYGIKAYLAALFSFIVLRADILIVQHLLDAAQAGYYSIAVSMSDLVYMLPVVIGIVLFPELSAMQHTWDKWQYSKRVALFVALIMLVITVILMIISKPLILLMFGTTYLPAVPAFAILMPAILLLSINTVFMNFFASIGMPLIVVYSPGFASLINIGLNVVLTPTFGIVGTSISSLIAYGIMLAFSAGYIKLRFNDNG